MKTFDVLGVYGRFVGILTLAALGTGLVVGVVPSASGLSDAVRATTAQSSYSFLDSVGVNVHMTYNDTGYADVSQVTSLLTGLGVRHVRDGLSPGRADQLQALRTFGANGITSDLILGTPSQSGAAETFDPAYLNEIDSSLTGDVSSVEEPNEYDCSGDPAWALDLRAYDESMYTAVRSDPAMDGIPVLGPSFCREPNAAFYGPLPGSADDANLHTYPSGVLPEISSEDAIREAATASDVNHVTISETGYQNALDHASGQLAVTDSTAADYVPRQVLDDFANGATRTYLYELLDEHANSALDDPEQHFGLVNADGTVKPAYTALSNLLHDVARGNPMTVSPASNPAAGAPLQVEGGGALLRHVVLADPQGGGYTVALWLAEPLENPNSHQPLLDASTDVRVNLAGRFSATSQRPSRGNATVGLGTGSSFNVPVDGAVTLLHVAPISARVAPTGCRIGAGQAFRQLADGAVVSNQLSPTSTAWSIPTSSDSSLPVDAGPGSQVTAPSTTSVEVPNAPSRWTVAVWEKTDPSSASDATFVQPAGVPGALLRTYDLTSEAATHDQVSAYGAPPVPGNWGVEMFGQAAVGSWHMFAVTDDGTSTSLYVDGVLVGTALGGPQQLTTLTLGAVTPTWRGSIAALSVYPTALSASKILGLATTDALSCPVGSTLPGPAPLSGLPPAKRLVQSVADVVVHARGTKALLPAQHEVRSATSRIACIEGARWSRTRGRAIGQSTCPPSDRPLRLAVKSANENLHRARVRIVSTRVTAFRLTAEERSHVAVSRLRPDHGPLATHRKLQVRRNGATVSMTWVGPRLTQAELRRGVTADASRAGLDTATIEVRPLTNWELRNGL